MPGGARISFNCVDSALSSLKNCQSYINTGMDIATHVALDLVESFSKYILSCIVSWPTYFDLVTGNLYIHYRICSSSG